MLIIGLTGGLGTGKSTAASILKKWGAKIIDADKIVHDELSKMDSCIVGAVIHMFGVSILNNNQIDRKRLGAIVFKNKRLLKQLENIIHPVVRRRIKEQIQFYQKNNQKGIIVVDVPLLFESGLDKLMHKVIVVKANQKIQIQRACQKLKITMAEAKRRIQNQMPLKDKIRKADFIIDNSGDFLVMRKQLLNVWKDLQTSLNL